ncbi:MAG: polysaccharide deacetylase family protein [Ktedonobacteraceae bacterium]|nr:polysaccharide deacetylase family protein [Ktedonobacteraceae bacterium]
MRKRILVVIAGIFYYSGLVALARWLTQRAGPRVVILNYHSATGGSFLQHMQYLRRHYRIMHVEAALEELYAQRKDSTYKSGKRTPLVITLDDGYRDNFTYAQEIAHDLSAPISIYLIPGYIESGSRFWWLEGKSMARRAQVEEVAFADRTFHLKNPEERGALAQYIDNHARFATSVTEREEFLASTRALLDLSLAPHEKDRDDAMLPVNWEQVKAMDEGGWVSFGAHTMHHPILSYLTNPDEVRQEVAECRRVLEQKLGHPVRTFAYPVGQAQHIGSDVVQAVRDAGYDWALTTTYGINTPQTDPVLLKRIEADVDQHWLVVAAEAAGLWGFISRLRWLPFIRKNFTNASRQKGM